MPDLLSTGVSGLLAFRRGLDATANNIANANTPGYTRQVPQYTIAPGGQTPVGYIGNGVQVSSVKRIYDQFLAVQHQSTISSEARLSTMDSLAAQVDRLVANPETALNPALQSFFSAVQDVSNEPSSIAARQTLIGSAEGLVGRVKAIDGRLASLDNEINLRLQESVKEVNRLSASIADLNEEIVASEGKTGQPANGLLDRRDGLVQELAARVEISTVQADDGSINVVTGSGQSLVLGNRAESLAVLPSEYDPTRFDIAYRTVGGDAPLAAGSLGGSIGGLLEFRSQLLDPARRTLGQTTAALTLEFNNQHAKGTDLNGALGGEFFSVGTPRVLPSQYNSGSGGADVAIANVQGLKDTDYLLEFDGAAYSLTRTDNGQTVSLSGTGSVADPFVADGLEIVVSGAPAAGDRMLIQPTATVAADIEVDFNDPEKIAAAAPTRSRVSSNNLGDGKISETEISDLGVDTLSPVTLEFTAASTYTVNGAGSFTYTSGEPITVNGNSFTITGAPAAGDQFFIEPNAGASGDNRNAATLAGLQTAGILADGTVSISDNYGALVADVGNRAGQIQANLTAQTVLLDNIEADVASTSGVNLDEEAANLIKFQQAYEAAAQVIAVTDTLFQTLLSAVRR